jgi:DNA-directed RNA polymerase I, II, and III subunit RPABC5
MSGFPIRCFSCNKVVGQYEEKYKKLLEEGKSSKEALDLIGMKRYCCRRMFLGHVDILNKVISFEKNQE